MHHQSRGKGSIGSVPSPPFPSILSPDSGSLEMDTEVAEGFVDGKCVKKDGAAIKGLLILCRKDIEDIVGL